MTPQVVVNADAEGAEVPRQFVKDGQIVLNISPTAVVSLSLGNELVEFGARFGGTPFQVSVPTSAVIAVLARENGAGMSFPEGGDGDNDPPPPTPKKPESKKRQGPQLRVVK